MVSDKVHRARTVTDVIIKMNLEGNNGRNLHSGRRLMKKQRMFMRLNQMIPSYKLIPEEERCLSSMR